MQQFLLQRIARSGGVSQSNKIFSSILFPLNINLYCIELIYFYVGVGENLECNIILVYYKKVLLIPWSSGGIVWICSTSNLLIYVKS